MNHLLMPIPEPQEVDAQPESLTAEDGEAIKLARDDIIRQESIARHTEIKTGRGGMSFKVVDMTAVHTFTNNTFIF